MHHIRSSHSRLPRTGWALLPLLLAACGTTASEPIPHAFSSQDVPATALPDEGLGPAAFHHLMPAASPESLLAVLPRAGVRVLEAWAPLDNRCLDPVGPTFTIVVSDPDVTRLRALGFLPGEGRLLCATMLRHFLPSTGG